MVTVLTSGWMDVPVNEYIPHDCTMKAVTANAKATDIVAHIVLPEIIS